MAVTSGIIGGVAALASAGVSYKSSTDARNDAQDAARKQQQAASDMQQQARDKQIADQQSQSANQMAAVQQQRARATAAQGTFGGTLLTGPQGVGGGTQAGTKTLLGS